MLASDAIGAEPIPELISSEEAFPAAQGHTSRKQVRIHTNRLRREREKWHSINRSLRDEQRHLEEKLLAAAHAKDEANTRRKQRSMGHHEPPITTGLAFAQTRARHQRRELELHPAPERETNPFQPVRIADHLDQLPPVDPGSVRSLDEIRERLRAQEEAATAAMERLDGAKREDATAQAKQFAKRGNQFLAAGDLAAATSSYEKAVSAARAANDPSLVAVLLASRAEVHFANRKYASALNDAREAAAMDSRVVDAASEELMRVASELVEVEAPTKIRNFSTPEPAPLQPSQQLQHSENRRNRAKQPKVAKPRPPDSVRSASGPRAARTSRTERKPKPKPKPKRGPLPTREITPLHVKIQEKRTETQRIMPERAWLGLERELNWHRKRNQRMFAAVEDRQRQTRAGLDEVRATIQRAYEEGFENGIAEGYKRATTDSSPSSPHSTRSLDAHTDDGMPGRLGSMPTGNLMDVPEELPSTVYDDLPDPSASDGEDAPIVAEEPGLSTDGWVKSSSMVEYEHNRDVRGKLSEQNTLAQTGSVLLAQGKEPSSLDGWEGAAARAEEERAAIIKLQAFYRGRLARLQIVKSHVAAGAIQEVHRTRMAARQAAERELQRMEEERRRFEAAIREADALQREEEKALARQEASKFLQSMFVRAVDSAVENCPEQEPELEPQPQPIPAAEPEPEVAEPEAEPEVTEPEAEPEVAKLENVEREAEPELAELQSESEVAEPEVEPEVTELQSEPEKSEPEAEPEVAKPKVAEPEVEPEVTELQSEPAVTEPEVAEPEPVEPEAEPEVAESKAAEGGGLVAPAAVQGGVKKTVKLGGLGTVSKVVKLGGKLQQQRRAQER